jgi:hypothetical protein
VEKNAIFKATELKREDLEDFIGTVKALGFAPEGTFGMVA